MLIRIPHYEAQQGFSRYNLADVLAGINRTCRQVAKGQQLVSKSSALQTSPVWAAAETARLALCWCREPDLNRSGQDIKIVQWEHLENLCDIASDTMMTARTIGTAEAMAKFNERTVPDVAQHIFAPQMLLQRDSTYRAGQALLMYSEAARRRHQRKPEFRIDLHEEALQNALGCDIESFVLAVRQTQGRSLSDEFHITADVLIPSRNRAYDDTKLWTESDGGLRLAAAGVMLEILSATPTMMRQWMEQEWATLNLPNHGPRRAEGQVQFTEDERARAFLEAPNPLHRYPLVRVFRTQRDHCIAPVPHLLNEWLYEPLAAFLHESFDLQGQKRMDQVFEEYVGLVAEICSPDGGKWLHEDELRPDPQANVVDWARPFDNSVVLLDAKKGYVSLARRYRSQGEDWTSVQRTNWTKAVVQGTKFWEDVKHGKVATLARDRNKRPIIVVVSFSDTDWRAHRADMHQEILSKLPAGTDPLPYLIMSIDRFERIVSSWSDKGIEWLPEFLEKATVAGDDNDLRHLPAMTTGKLVNAFNHVFETLERQVAQ